MSKPVLKSGDLTPGEKVDIISGPFKGGRAVVQTAAQHEVKVLMQVLGQPTEFTVSLDQIRRARLQASWTDTDHLPAHHP